MENKIRRRKASKEPPKDDPHRRQKAYPALCTFSNIKAFTSFLVLLSVLLFGCLYLRSQHIDNSLVPFGESFPMESLLGRQYWSSLLSGHYFGLQAASPNTPVFSMMWFRNRVNQRDGFHIRHWCNQGDNLEKFFWNYNDLKFGHQSIQDKNLQIITSFIKLDNGEIKARIRFVDRANHTKDSQFEKISLVLYSAIEGNDDTVEVLNHQAKEGGVSAVRVQSKAAGNYVLHCKVINGKVFFQGLLMTNSTMDQLTETVKNNLYLRQHPHSEEPIIAFANHVGEYRYNFAASQIIFQKQLEIEVDLLFENSPPSSSSSHLADGHYDGELQKRIQQFDRAFEERFPLRSKNFSDDMVTFARAVLSNTIGGISYFYGYSLVKSEHNSLARPYGPLQLLTAVPSRPFFPRGFLWDEGFHQLLISSWDPGLSKTIIKSWFGLMNKDGWIPREVILGDEAMARVPSEFLVQDSTFANPPALFLAIENLIDQQQADRQWLSEIFPRLEKWFQWFNTTQRGNEALSFRWRGRNATTNRELNPKTLTSGLDDFPRASHPTDDEIHLDLRCWMALASRVMAKISQALSIKDDAYSSFYDVLRDNQQLERLHWSSEDNMFCDRGLHTDDLQMVNIKRKDGQVQLIRKVLSKPRYRCVPHFGYNSLFPLLMGLLDPTNPKLETMLQQIEDPTMLWTPYGLRSLSKGSFYYDKYNTLNDAPYWRGAIWIPINFLALKGLNHYSTVPGPYQAKAHSVYVRLRKNLIQNVFQQYRRTNYVWEHYSDKTGQGQGTYPMTGWTALIVRIMGENY